MTRASVQLGLSLALAIVGGLLFSVFTELDPGFSWVTGLLLMVVGELFFLLLRQQDVARLSHAIASATDQVSASDRFSRFVIVTALSEIGDPAFSFAAGAIEVRDPGRVPSFWNECLANMDASLRVASHIHPARWWGKGYSEVNEAIQAQKRQVGVSVSRVSIYEEADELTQLAPAIERQRAAGLDVRTIAGRSLRSEPELSRHVERLGTFDVGLVDERWAVIHRLDKGRASDSLVLSWRPEDVDEVRAYLSALWSVADPVD